MSNSSGNELILIVDDAPDTVEILQRNLSLQGYRTMSASGVMEAITILDSTAVDLVITDLKMPRVSGLDLVRHVRDNLPNTEVMMITGYASIEGAVEAVKTGAEEYLAKPFTNEELNAAVKRALDKLFRRRAFRPKTHRTPRAPHGLIGESAPMLKVFNSISRAASSTATVLITGESGTGKELVARAIHYCSPRSSAPFVPVSCGAIPEGLL
jgi:two-component system response regulator HydG